MPNLCLPRALLVGLLALTPACSEGDLSTPEIDAALRQIQGPALEAHMRTLAADELQGRGTGTAGYLMAAEYVADQFESLGLRPLEGTRTYYQPVPLRSTELMRDESGLTLIRDGRRVELEMEQDFVMRGDPLRKRGEITAPLVFVGYGVTAPDSGYDDYEGVDVRGKIVVLFRGAPPTLQHNERAYYASDSVKLGNAVARGAVGVILMLTPEDRGRRRWDRIVGYSRYSSMTWVDDGGDPQRIYPELLVGAMLSESGEAALFEGSPVSFDEVAGELLAGRPRSFVLPLEMEARTASAHGSLTSSNVVAMLPGSDPDLAREYVVLTAHLDGLGIGEPVEGDAINNGAYDNASGIASMLEIARAFKTMSSPPRRSLIFLATTGEEKGLLGSDYFASLPPVPKGSMVANINLDMVLMLHPLNDVIAFGAEHSSLSGPVERAAATLGLKVAEDPMPEEVLFIRSDQYSFVRQGIPSLFIVAGRESGDDSIDGRALEEEWIKTTYHSPGDDMDQPIDFEAGAAFARMNFLVVHVVANETDRPAWNPGDFFGQRFGVGG